MPTAQTRIFVLFLSTGVLIDGAFSLWVSLKCLKFHIAQWEVISLVLSSQRPITFSPRTTHAFFYMHVQCHIMRVIYHQNNLLTKAQEQAITFALILAVCVLSFLPRGTSMGIPFYHSSFSDRRNLIITFVWCKTWCRGIFKTPSFFLHHRCLTGL